MNNKCLLLFGNSCVGKDTVFSRLPESNFINLKLSDVLKDYVHSLFPQYTREVFELQEYKNSNRYPVEISFNELTYKYKTPRDALIGVGKLLERNNPTWVIDKTFERLKDREFGNSEVVVITDLRQMNQYEKIIEYFEKVFVVPIFRKNYLDYNEFDIAKIYYRVMSKVDYPRVSVTYPLYNNKSTENIDIFVDRLLDEIL